MEKAIAIIDQNPTLKDLVQAMEAMKSDMLKKKEAIDKQLQDLFEEFMPKRNELWGKITEYLKVNNCLPDDFSNSKYNLSITDEGTITISELKDEKEKMELAKLLKRIVVKE